MYYGIYTIYTTTCNVHIQNFENVFEKGVRFFPVHLFLWLNLSFTSLPYTPAIGQIGASKICINPEGSRKNFLFSGFPNHIGVKSL